MERAAGIEPAYTAWEAVVLPLNYARKLLIYLISRVVQRRWVHFGHSIKHAKTAARSVRQISEIHSACHIGVVGYFDCGVPWPMWAGHRHPMANAARRARRRRSSTWMQRNVVFRCDRCR